MPLGHWLPRSGWDVADSPVFEDFLNNPQDTDPADLRTDIYMPLRDRVERLTAERFTPTRWWPTAKNSRHRSRG